jgi:hypothetical protein
VGLELTGDHATIEAAAPAGTPYKWSFART